jgi:hypothetical protein
VLGVAGFYIFGHFLPLFLIILGYGAKVFFFIKIKWLWYRIAIALSIVLNTWLFILISHDLDYLFYLGATIGKEDLTIGQWEQYNIARLLTDIMNDLLFYYLYSHRKIITKEISFHFKDFKYLINESKDLRYILIFLFSAFFVIMVFLESVIVSKSTLIELIKELRKE